MALRWSATGVLEASKNFRRAHKAYRLLPIFDNGRVPIVRGPKIRVFRRKRRKGMRRTRGHRTDLTRVRITEITADGDAD